MANYDPMKMAAAIHEIRLICEESDGRSQCSEWGSSAYKDSIRHFVSSSSEVAQLAVQPGSASDLGMMIQTIAYYRVPFAVKGAGHAMSPTISSTTGIQFYMARLNRVRPFPDQMSVEVGAGCVWEQVYQALLPLKQNVVGGSASEGVGVGGWLLGGGWSLKSNRYGLGIDNILAYEVVTPNGSILQVTEQNHAQLFQALRGGGNNFGIVTKFILRTHMQQDCTYGARFQVDGNRTSEVKNAIARFVDEESSPDSSIVVAFRHTLDRAQQGVIKNHISMLLVLDGPKPLHGSPFRDFELLSHTGDVWKSDPAGWWLGALDALSTPDEQTIEKPSVKASKKMDRGSKNMSTYMFYGVERRTFMVWSSANICSKLNPREIVFPQPVIRNLAFCTTSKSTYSRQYPRDHSNERSTARVHHEARAGTGDKRCSSHNSNGLHNLRPWKHVSKKPCSLGERDVRARFGSLMISKFTSALLDKMTEEAANVATFLEARSGINVSIECWPAHKTIFDNSPPGAAFPHEPGQPFGPMLVYLTWSDEKEDEFWITTLNRTLNKLRKAARELGLTPKKPAYYSNISLETVPSHKIYRDNMTWLRGVKAQYDPTDVMGLAGGHKIPLPSEEDR